MRTSSLKLLFSAALLFGTMISVNAQTSTGLHAWFKGTSSEIKNSVADNTLVFFMSGIETKTQLDDFLKKSEVYAKGFSLTAALVNGVYECKVTFNGTPEIRWLQRFFVAVSVADVQQDRETKSIDDFFKGLQ